MSSPSRLSLQGTRDLIGNVKEMGAAVVSITVLSSVAYETGYFTVFGRKYQGILGTSDYISSALEWFPWLAFLYGAAFLSAHSQVIRLTGFASRILNRGSLLGLAGFGFIVAGVLLSTIPFYRFLQFMPLITLPAVVFILSYSVSANHHFDRLRGFSLSAAVLILSLYSSGIGNAHRDVAGIRDAYILVAKDGQRGVQVLRNFQKYILIWIPQDQRAEAIASDKIEKITKNIWKGKNAPWLETLSCRMFDWFCKQRPITL